jgi:hypothetical protein
MFRLDVQKIAAELEGVETKEEIKPTLDKGAMWAPARGSRDC